jgi:UDP-glucose 4-epimerase
MQIQFRPHVRCRSTRVMLCLITGCAGFVGSNVVDRLLAEGWDVRGIDNFSTGRERFLARAICSPRFELLRRDILDGEALIEPMRGVDVVFHLAANADVRFGPDHPNKDLEQNTIGTFHVLEAMRRSGVRRIVFASTGSVYGEASIIPTPEDAPFPVQTSLYGASKVAAEGLIAAFCESFGFAAHIFRFVSLLGERYSHGHVVDFYRQLLSHPDRLDVLGNGTQKKSYLYVRDCIDAMLLALAEARNKVNIFNLGADEYCTVSDSVGWICSHLGLQPEIRFSGGDRGWVGDNPFIYLDTRRIRALGWTPRLSIRDGVLRTLDYLQAEPSLLAQS